MDERAEESEALRQSIMLRQREVLTELLLAAVASGDIDRRNAVLLEMIDSEAWRYKKDIAELAGISPGRLTQIDVGYRAAGQSVEARKNYERNRRNRIEIRALLRRMR